MSKTTGFQRRGSRRSFHKSKSAFAFSHAESGQRPGELIRKGTLKTFSPNTDRKATPKTARRPNNDETTVISEQTTTYKDIAEI